MINSTTLESNPIKDYKNKFSELTESRDAFMTGAKYGVLGGALLGLFMRKNVLIYGAVGFIIGGYINSQIHKQGKEYKQNLPKL